MLLVVALLGGLAPELALGAAASRPSIHHILSSPGGTEVSAESDAMGCPCPESEPSGHSGHGENTGDGERIPSPPGCKGVSWWHGCFPYFSTNPLYKNDTVSVHQLNEVEESLLKGYGVVLLVTFAWQGSLEFLHRRYADPRYQFQYRLFKIFISEVAVVGVVSIVTSFWTAGVEMAEIEDLALEYVHLQIFLAVAVLKCAQLVVIGGYVQRTELRWRQASHHLVRAEVELEVVAGRSAQYCRGCSSKNLVGFFAACMFVSDFPSAQVYPALSLLVYRRIFDRKFGCGGKLFDSEFDYVAYISKSSVEYMIDTAEVTKFTWAFALTFYLGADYTLRFAASRTFGCIIWTALVMLQMLQLRAVLTAHKDFLEHNGFGGPVALLPQKLQQIGTHTTAARVQSTYPMRDSTCTAVLGDLFHRMLLHRLSISTVDLVTLLHLASYLIDRLWRYNDAEYYDFDWEWAILAHCYEITCAGLSFFTFGTHIYGLHSMLKCSIKLDHDALSWVLHHQHVLGKMIVDIRSGILDSFRTSGSVDESLETNVQSETNSPSGSLVEHCAILFDQMDECSSGLVDVEQLRDGFGMIGCHFAKEDWTQLIVHLEGDYRGQVDKATLVRFLTQEGGTQEAAHVAVTHEVHGLCHDVCQRAARQVPETTSEKTGGAGEESMGVGPSLALSRGDIQPAGLEAPVLAGAE